LVHEVNEKKLFVDETFFLLVSVRSLTELFVSCYL